MSMEVFPSKSLARPLDNREVGPFLQTLAAEVLGGVFLPDAELERGLGRGYYTTGPSRWGTRQGLEVEGGPVHWGPDGEQVEHLAE